MTQHWPWWPSRPGHDAAAAPPAPGHAGDAVVDCALYVGGARRRGPRTHAELLAEARSTPDAFVWIGLHEPDAAQMDEVAAVFGLHRLAVEDALSAEQRPKLERYEDVAFLVVRAAGYVEHAELTDTSEVVETGSVRMFVADKFVVTVRHGAIGGLRAVRADLETDRDLLAQGPWAVVHAICDRIVDGYLDIAAAFQRDLDLVEAQVLRRAASAGIGQIYQLKRELVEFRGAVLPLQQPLATILDGSTVKLTKEIRRYFRDVADHNTRVADRIGGFDDLLNSMLQARLAQVTVDQNDDMRKIASWAALAALQTAFAGIYGMNFKYMPELGWRYGYPVLLIVMLGVSALLYWRLRRSGWL
ncbi:magnesium and cobalt transport protein CorA [Dactylosporangium sp. AC04546]|uniref:magnesium and cobalt transport protein CorA n=1 Tax=Dactylosporangium sp. AC04546 TaxID=2862460 RepID=UPI001EE0CF44|nr:magnesium and cobalt transport protein CorA [Dactylosporangium sp. AC04546]WVK78825.1 magnesium and cobalt transport protein CorA [Dactylosporangium sp. AC04546]